MANADVAWSGTAASTYAALRGTGPIVSLSLGTAATWDPGSNAAIAAAAATLKAAWQANNARAILIAPGCPARVTVRGVTQAWSIYDPAATGLPAFSTLVAGCPSFSEIFTAPNTLACRENGSGRWEWWIWAGAGPNNIGAWAGNIAWKLGKSNDRTLIDPAYEIRDIRPREGSPASFAPGALPTQAATQIAGWSGSRVVPVGRIGWTAWRLTSADYAETSTLWDDAVASATTGNSLLAQPEPMLFALNNGTGSIERWASFASRCRDDWGYDVDYFYRDASPPTSATDLLPVGGACWSKADFEGGTIVAAPYYVLAGDLRNTDDPAVDEPYKSALAPAAGASVTELGPSYGYEWAIQGLKTGAAAGSVDVTHRVSGETLVAWITAWQSLRGMSGIEAMWHTGGAPCPSGDPLYRPFHFDPAGTLPLIEDGETTIPPPVIPPITGGNDAPYYTGGGFFRKQRPTGHRRNIRR